LSFDPIFQTAIDLFGSNGVFMCIFYRYHSALHAADVMQTMNFFLVIAELGAHVSELLQMSALVAAAIHDLGHPGVNNSFLVHSTDRYAIRYNDNSPLENMHAATAFEIMKDPDFNILSGLSKKDRADCRASIISMILGTDNAMHAKHLGQLEAKLAGDKGIDWDCGEDQDLMLVLTLHASDVSNPCKNWDVYLKWTAGIMDEFYTQGIMSILFLPSFCSYMQVSVLLQQLTKSISNCIAWNMI
jgi:hypothetical protein